MYTVVDIINQTHLSFAAKEDLLLWWKKTLGTQNYEELNVTGHDTRWVTETCRTPGTTDIAAFMCPIAERALRLRRYQVLDEKGKSVDIRRWPDSAWSVEMTSQESDYSGTGGKRLVRMVNGPSLFRRTVGSQDQHIDLEELMDAGLPLPNGMAPNIRNSFRGFDPDSHVEGWHAKKYHASKAWKDQCKAPRQWARHKTWGRKALATAEESADALLLRLRSDGFSVLCDG